jgi:NAD(P)-dependent dehydrogenase (short-subunit alcohol dehydrogenase family)
MKIPALFDLNGRVAVVTGGNGGIGRGIAWLEYGRAIQYRSASANAAHLPGPRIVATTKDNMGGATFNSLDRKDALSK